MATLENRQILLAVDVQTAELVLYDKARRAAWLLDRASLAVFRRLTAGSSAHRETLPAPSCIQRLDDAMVIAWALPEGELRTRWTLGDDHVRVLLEAVPAEIERVAFPGSFAPTDGRADLLIPSYQGFWYRAGGDPWEEEAYSGGHRMFSLAMTALLAPRAGLLMTQERTLTHWWCRYGEAKDRTFCSYEQTRCEIEGWQEREVRLYPVDADITAVARRYRRRIQERGEFCSWDEKIARKPILEKLFGGLMAFIGYNKAPEVDYIASAQELHDYGFDTVLYYPVRMCNYSLGFLMGGDQPIWFSDEDIRRLKAVPGALVAPWGWFIEGLDDGSERMRSMYRRQADGSTYRGWTIDHFQWHTVCTPCQVEESRRRFATDMQAMDWIHYDVNATLGLRQPPCHCREHAQHGNRPLTGEADVEWTLRLLSPETNGNRIVSSEGLVDRFAMCYDIGSTKFMPSCAPSRFIAVPLTGLVLHDSIIHDWWEASNYNEIPGLPIREAARGRMFGSGMPAKKAAMDALYGCPPNVFTFGRQYAWTDIESRRTFSFCIRLDDREVQRALKAALPVAKLHKRTGKQDLRSVEFLSADYAVQATTFSDGTRVVANIGDWDREVDGLGMIPANSWRVVA